MRTLTHKNYTMELFKLFAAYMVIFIHVPFYGTFGIIMDALARFAVPFFFFVSGFFSYQISLDKIKKRIAHIFRLLIFTSLIYNIWNIVDCLIDGGAQSVYNYIGNYLSLKTLFKIFVMGIPVSAVHIWYLISLIYVYLVLYFITKFSVKYKLLYIFAFIFLAINLLMGEGLSVLGIVIPSYLLRNFLLTGIPFFAIGLLARENEEKLISIPNYIILISFVTGITATLISRNLFGKNDLYTGSVFILFSVIILSLKHSDKQYPAFLIKFSSYSTNIYILHLLVRNIFQKTINAEMFPIPYSLYQTLRVLLLCIVTTILAALLNFIQKKINK